MFFLLKEKKEKTDKIIVTILCGCMWVTDRHHFDNPVYCYPTGGANGIAGATAAVGGLNNTRIRNDLGCSSGTKSNLTNLERAKLGPNSLDDDCSEGISLNFGWVEGIQ